MLPLVYGLKKARFYGYKEVAGRLPNGRGSESDTTYCDRKNAHFLNFHVAQRGFSASLLIVSQ